jgi:hypothetical protein
MQGFLIKGFIGHFIELPAEQCEQMMVLMEFFTKYRLSPVCCIVLEAGIHRIWNSKKTFG